MTKEEINDLTMKFLVEEKGFDVNYQGPFTFTPLTGASERNPDVALALIRAGADVNLQDGRGYTPLDRAITFKQYDICKCLIENGVDINIPYFNKKLYIETAI